MAEVGTYYITIMPSMSKFTQGVKDSLNGLGTDTGKQFSSTFMDTLKGSALGTAIGSLATQLGGQLMSGLSTGIDRLDTIENFPRVMQALGYESGQADDSIKLIMERLRGLPSTTQDVVRLTQAIADSTGDLDLATKAALGFNDMMVANGASAAEQVQAQGVLNRVLGKGSATVAQWQSLVSVMPAQIGAVAREMLGADASAEELHTALEDGTVSWNDFLQAIVRLDQEGSGSMASFEQQARENSKGIGTAIENLKNRIGQGWADILGAIGQTEISTTLSDMADRIKDAMDVAAGAVTYLKEAIGNTDIVEHAGQVLQTIGDALSGIWSDGGPEGIKAVADAMVDLIDNAFDWLADHGELVKTAVWGITGALAGLAGWKLGTDLTRLPGIFKALMGAFSANPFVAVAIGIAGVVGALYGFFTQTETGQKMWSDFCQTMSDLWQGLQEDWSALWEVVTREWDSFTQTMGEVGAFLMETFDEVLGWVMGVGADLGRAFGEMFDSLSETLEANGGVWGVLTAGAQQAVDGVKQWWAKAVEDAKVYWGLVKAAVALAWTWLKASVVAKVTETVEAVKQWWANVLQATTERWEAVKQAVLDKAQALKDGAVQRFEAMKTAVTDTVDRIRQGISDKFNAAKDTVLGIFNDIKQGISDKIQEAKDTVSRIIDEIKGLFNFSWSLPRPSLPHIDWHWNDIGGLLKIPVFDGISWFAKGGVFDAASIIGIGEAGREAALPLNRGTYTQMARGITREMGDGYSGVVVNVTGNEFNVREEDDIDRIAERIAVMVGREMGAMA